MSGSRGSGPRAPRLFTEIYERWLVDLQSFRAEGFPVATVPAMAARKDRRDSVFEEGARFAPIVEGAASRAVTTLVASPHSALVYSLSDMLHVVEHAVGRAPDSSLALASELVSAQLMVWWTPTVDSSEMDLSDVGRLQAQDAREFLAPVVTQTKRAVKAVHSLTGTSPTVWGCWGHSTPAEQQRVGLGRGHPTVATGHLHVTGFQSHKSDRVRVTPRMEALVRSHVAAYTSSIYQRLSEHIAPMIFDELCNSTKDLRRVRVSRPGVVGAPGFEVVYARARPLQEVLLGISRASGALAAIYETALRYRSTNDTALLTDLTDICLPSGRTLDARVAVAIIDFLKDVTPTYGQLKAAHMRASSEQDDLARHALDLEMARYRRAHEAVGRARGPRELGYLIADTVDPRPSEGRVNLWPARMTGFFVMHLADGEDELVNGVILSPMVFSRVSAVEQVTQAALIRK